MIVGFTGTRQGMSVIQKAFLGELLIDLKVDELHHGCCVGADDQANTIARSLGIKTMGHPPLNKTQMADCATDYMYKPRQFLDRNHDIVNAGTILLVAPRSGTEEQRSGTWATWRYANKINKNVIILSRGS